MSYIKLPTDLPENDSYRIAATSYLDKFVPLKDKTLVFDHTIQTLEQHIITIAKALGATVQIN